MTRSKAASVLKAVAAKPYRLAFEDAALAEWKKLDSAVKENFRKLLRVRLQNPRIASAALHGELTHCYKIKLQQQGYRLVYQVIDQTLLVVVISFGRRDKDAVYRAAIKRLMSKK